LSEVISVIQDRSGGWGVGRA